MPETSSAARTRKVSTTTTEEVPVDPGERQGLGMPWQEYLATVPEDELAITTVYIYRKEPPTISGFLLRSGGDGKSAERIDDQWLEDHFGGGTFDLTIRSKSGKSHYERTVRIAGLPKLTDKEKIAAPAPSPAAVAVSADNTAILDLLGKTIDRLERLQTNMNTPQRSAADDSVVEIMATAAKRGIEVAAGGSPAVREADEMDKMLRKAMLDRLLAPPAVPAESDFDKQLKKVMLDRLLAPPPSQNKSLIEELKGLAELRDLMGWSEGAGKGEHWTTALIHQAPAVLDKLGELNSTRLETAQTELRRAEIIANARRGVVTPPPAHQSPAVQTSANHPPAARPAAPQPGPAPAAGPIRMAPMDGGGTSAAPPAEAINHAPPSMEGLDTESPAIVQFVKERVVAMVQEGTPGGGIVAFLIGMRQEKFVQMLVKYTPEQISAFLRADPILRQAVEHPDWADVLEEARGYVHDQEVAAAAPPLVQ